jgi:hypothetical protein
VGFDLMAINSLLSPVFVAGFYYKTFMGPTRKAWMFYEHFIRKPAGLGVASQEPDPDRYDWHHDFADLLVVGSGPAGLTAALTAARSGVDVTLVEQDVEFGGSLLNHAVDSPQALWLVQRLADLASTGRVRAVATAALTTATRWAWSRCPRRRGNAARGVPRQRLHIVREGNADGLRRDRAPARFPPGCDAGRCCRCIREPVRGAGPSRRVRHQQRCLPDAIALAKAGAHVTWSTCVPRETCVRQARADNGSGHAQGGHRVTSCLLAPFDRPGRDRPRDYRRWTGGCHHRAPHLAPQHQAGLPGRHCVFRARRLRPRAFRRRRDGGYADARQRGA